MAMFIVDRRLNSGSKSLENRQRFLCRAKALVQGAVKKTFEGRDIKDVLEGGEVSIPQVGINQPHDLDRRPPEDYAEAGRRPHPKPCGPDAADGKPELITGSSS